MFAPQAWEDYLHWQSADRTVIKRINRLIANSCRSSTTPPTWNEKTPACIVCL